MRILLVGQAAAHRSRLQAHLGFEACFTETQTSLSRDRAFAVAAGEVDVVVSLQFPALALPAPSLRLLHVPGAGLDGIDMAAVPERASVCNVYEHEVPIAEFVMLAMLHHATGLDDMRARFAAGWSEAYHARVPHRELRGQTLAIVGFGRIGRELAARAAAFGMHVLAVNRSGAGGGGLPLSVRLGARLQEVLAEADFVAICCPLDASTREMIGAEALNAMKPSAVLVNVSRAEIVAQAPLYAALRDGGIAAAYLDVWYRYPSAAGGPPADLPFGDLPNVVCTPHSSAWTEDLFERRYAFIADNIRRLRDGAPLRNVVRAPVAAR